MLNSTVCTHKRNIGSAQISHYKLYLMLKVGRRGSTITAVA
jgi:hypothetical protein